MQKVTLIPGDGIGPEITASIREIFMAADIPIEWEEINAGLGVFKKSGVLIPNEVKESLERNRVGLKGPTTTPVGAGHRSINVTMRQMFNLYANVRPAASIKGLGSLLADIDIITVRENSEDLYKGIEYEVSEGVAHGLKIITAEASERIGRHAFELAKRLGRKKVTVVHKANIMKLTDGLFLDSIRKVSAGYTDIEFNDVIVDNCAMQLVTKPQQFDIIVTENLYGDILSDLISGLIGGLGVAAGANLGDDMAIFEAVHGSAPDIAGKDLANPTALLFSGIMMLEHLGMVKDAARIRDGLFKTLADENTRTQDLGGELGTTQFTNAIIANLDN